MFTGTRIGDRIVLFGKSGETIRSNVKLKITGAGYSKVLIAGVEKGTWKITCTDSKKVKPIMVNNLEGLIYFKAIKANYLIATR